MGRTHVAVLCLLLAAFEGACESSYDGGSENECLRHVRDILQTGTIISNGKTHAAASLLALLRCSGLDVTGTRPSSFGDAPAATSQFLLPSFSEVTLNTNASADVLYGLSELLGERSFRHKTLPSHLQDQAIFNDATTRARFAWELRELAAARGSPGAQAKVALMRTYGLAPPPLSSPAAGQPSAAFEFEPPDLAAGFVHLYFAAAGNDSFASMALGHKHSVGANVPASCPAAVLYYQVAADQVVKLAAQPDGLPQLEYVRLSALQSTVKRVADRDVLELYQNSADMGDAKSATIVGDLLNHGTAGTPRNHAQAIEYFKQAAAAGDTEAMAHLGHMYANGLEVAQNNETALEWFLKAAEGQKPSASGLLGLGYMYLAGYGVERDYGKALTLLNRASQSDARRRPEPIGEAYFHLAVMQLLGWGVLKPNPEMAYKLFAQAALHGHVVATYNLAMMQLSGGSHHDCRAALKNLVKVAQRGPDMLHLALGFKHFQAHDFHRALFHYLLAAEMGIELGMSNAAWLLDRGLVPPNNHTALVALRLHQAAAAQDNLESLLAIGDAYYSGLGVPRSAATAASYYREACRPGRDGDLSFKHAYAHASFNLGTMHQFGIGMPVDHHLAKRYYDQAMNNFPEGQWAVRLALTSLRVHAHCLRLAERFPDAAKTLHAYAQNTLDWTYHHIRALLDSVYAYHTNGRVVWTEFNDAGESADSADARESATADDSASEADQGGAKAGAEQAGGDEGTQSSGGGEREQSSRPAADMDADRESELPLLVALLLSLSVLMILRRLMRANALARSAERANNTPPAEAAVDAPARPPQASAPGEGQGSAGETGAPSAAAAAAASQPSSDTASSDAMQSHVNDGALGCMACAAQSDASMRSHRTGADVSGVQSESLGAVAQSPAEAAGREVTQEASTLGSQVDRSSADAALDARRAAAEAAERRSRKACCDEQDTSAGS